MKGLTSVMGGFQNPSDPYGWGSMINDFMARSNRYGVNPSAIMAMHQTANSSKNNTKKSNKSASNIVSID